MSETVSFKPAGFHAVTPYILTENSARLIEFLKAAFGAEELLRMPGPDNRAVMHAQVRIGDSVIEMSDAGGQWQPMRCALHLYVPDADAVHARALAAGGTELYAPVDRPYGDREAGITDPSGNQWYIATHVKDVAVEELT
jgi:PhnB protein